jgi:hypothetical protein
MLQAWLAISRLKWEKSNAEQLAYMPAGDGKIINADIVDFSYP